MEVDRSSFGTNGINGDLKNPFQQTIELAMTREGVGGKLNCTDKSSVVVNQGVSLLDLPNRIDLKCSPASLVSWDKGRYSRSNSLQLTDQA